MPGSKTWESTDKTSSFPLAMEPKGLAVEPKKPPKGKKRTIAMETTGMDDGSYSDVMAAMISSFGADVSKSLAAKRKHLESFSDSSIKTRNKKVEDLWSSQRDERQRLGEEYKKQCSVILTQWEADLKKTKAEEEELQTLLKQKQKLLQKRRAQQTQHLNTIRKLHQQYMKGMEDLSSCHKEEQSHMMTDIKEGMTAFQKRIITETQYQDLSSMKHSLQTMLTQV